jgi:hypothetical protein
MLDLPAKAPGVGSCTSGSGFPYIFAELRRQGGVRNAGIVVSVGVDLHSLPLRAWTAWTVDCAFIVGRKRFWSFDIVRRREAETRG